MRKFSTLIHLKDKSQHIDRTLDSLKISDELLVIDHVATEETQQLLRKHGANVLDAIDGVHDGAYATNASNDWVLFSHPKVLMESCERHWKAGRKTMAARTIRWLDTLSRLLPVTLRTTIIASCDL